MKARMYALSDYTDVKGWWVDHGGAAVPETILPKSGVIVEHMGEVIAAAWVYMSNSNGVAWLAWLVTKPRMNVVIAAEAIAVCVAACERVARDLGYGLMLTMTERKSLGSFYQRHGYVANHTGMTQYFKTI